MAFHWSWREHASLGAQVLKWLVLATPLAAIVGSACALFLRALEWATQTQLQNPWLLLLLPAAGVIISLAYEKLGRGSEGGNNLLMDAIHSAQNQSSAGSTDAGKPASEAIVVPRRMAPLVLAATVATHLFGGSAGREGTAVQMGGSLASAAARALRLGREDTRTLLLCGLAAGFAGVFGTPITGAVFALEVLALGSLSYSALVPCLIAAVVGDWACGAWGVHHTHYAISPSAMPSLGGDAGARASLDWILAAKVALASVAFGLASVLFAELTHGLGRAFKRLVPISSLCPVAGAVCIIALVHILGTRDYLGLGVSSPDARAVTIQSSFLPGGAGAWSWWWKLLFTAITLGSGFKGGEVTPLFFVGAALGNTLSQVLGAPTDLFAGLGFLAVFAGATNTPLACTIMGIELFGAQYSLYFALACFLAYALSGHSGIYLSQRIGTPKLPVPGLTPLSSLRSVHEERAREMQERHGKS